MPIFQKYPQPPINTYSSTDEFCTSDFTPQDILTRVSDLLGCNSLPSRAGKCTCAVATHVSANTIARSQTKGQLLLAGHQINGDGIEPDDPEAITFGPSKVAKIKADAGINPIAGLGVQVTPKIHALIEH